MTSYTHAVLRERLLKRAGLTNPPPAPLSHLTWESLRRTEWSDRFEELMRNRLCMGALRYGLLHAPGKPQYDRVSSMLKRLKKYQESPNKELLVDVANLCLMEFEEGEGYFEAVDGDHRIGVSTTSG